MRPSHRHRCLSWVPGPRSRWARQQRRAWEWLPEPERSEARRVTRNVSDAYERLVGYREWGRDSWPMIVSLRTVCDLRAFVKAARKTSRKKKRGRTHAKMKNAASFRQ